MDRTKQRDRSYLRMWYQDQDIHHFEVRLPAPYLPAEYLPKPIYVLSEHRPTIERSDIDRGPLNILLPAFRWKCLQLRLLQAMNCLRCQRNYLIHQKKCVPTERTISSKYPFPFHWHLSFRLIEQYPSGQAPP